MEKRKIAIIGSGPASYTAAIYAARANLSPLVYEGFSMVGGQLMTTTDVENYPGFPQGIMGPELMDLFRKQAERFGTTCIAEEVTSVNFKDYPFLLTTSSGTIAAESVIIATGADAKKLDVPGNETFWQKGVTACAVCDGAMPIFRNQPLFVIGGGDTAVEEAIFLTRFGSRVFIVHRRDALRASKIMAKRAAEHPKIEILWNHVLEEISGDTVVRAVKVKNVLTGEITAHTAGGVFFAIGHQPNTAFLNAQVELAGHGYIKVFEGTTRTSVEGVFAAGDVQDPHYRQAVTAAGSGCMAALDAERWLAGREHASL